MYQLAPSYSRDLYVSLVTIIMLTILYYYSVFHYTTCWLTHNILRSLLWNSIHLISNLASLSYPCSFITSDLATHYRIGIDHSEVWTLTSAALIYNHLITLYTLNVFGFTKHYKCIHKTNFILESKSIQYIYFFELSLYTVRLWQFNIQEN